jgi:hypothetical protein
MIKRSLYGGVLRPTFGDGLGAGIRKLVLLTPLRLRGNFANPVVSLEKGPWA